ncbi:hypothetical protein ACK8P5_26590 (plasmid) [Paenibacillus sp. EC2-1]|uniref:hypothetical protein n=1 Tax=Paenibacillus sp. EC2-1 TaxID=3388665 RepID=UPI003BEF26F2
MIKAQEKNMELSNGCSMYDPCPICFKCKAKASHLYVRCFDCPVEFCGHSEKQRAMLIRRENFAITVSKETERKIAEWTEQRKRDEEK